MQVQCDDWSTLIDLDWRGFRVPWIYTLDDDLFVQSKRPPSADDLSLEPWIVQDSWGEEIELERPTTYPLDDDAAPALAGYAASAWDELQAARATSLSFLQVPRAILWRSRFAAPCLTAPGAKSS